MKLESALYPEKRLGFLRKMKISNNNLKNIEDIRTIIEVEEGKEVTTQETLDRVLQFYKKYVPYN
jgi:hypothetical protein